MTSPIPWWVLPTLAVIVMAIYTGALAASFFVQDTTLRNILFGGALSQATMVVSYYYGSSSGSAKKDDVIANKMAQSGNH